MLTNILGVRLVLLLGDTLPLPASYDVMTALQRVEVTNDDAQGDGFQMTFALARDGIVDYTLLNTRALDPVKRVIIGVIFGALPEVLIDGLITHHQFNPGNAPGEATLTVSGRDLTIKLNMEEKDAEYPNQADFIIFNRLIADYASYGLIPMATPTSDFPIMFERIPRQQETDLEFIRRLAQRNGFVFYIEPLTFGVNNAYFGPENRLGLPQHALSVNLGPATNVKSLQFVNDALAPAGTRGSIVEPFTKTSIPVPALPSLKIPPLAAMPATPHRTRLQRDTAKQNAGTAATRLLAEVTRAPDAFSADGELDSVRYGHALRARRLVGVRGAGLTHNGFWYVRHVTHSITRTGYSQRFRLSREGSTSLTPMVVP